MKIRLASSLMFLAFCVPVVIAEDKPESVAKRKANEIAQATVKGDFEKIADFTYPKVVDQMGGREKMVTAMKTGYKEMKSRGIEFRSAKVEDASPLVAGGSDVYTIVPFTLEMKVPGGSATMKSFLLGISANKGTTWTFVDGSGIGKDETMTKRLLPNLPKELKLPKKEQPVFHKDG
ncbi:MAG TPA: hypothetical protein VE999_20430 [Gemmataceae bacterium]|nr:hypothetical protein [Gemmataceae bacterium]